MAEEILSTPEPVPQAPQPMEALTNPDTHNVAFHDDKDGSTFFVRPDDVQATLAEGARPATRDEYWGARGAGTGAVAAAAMGAARSLSFGASDPIIVAAIEHMQGADAANDVRAELRGQQTGHPTASLAGEIGGAVVPAFFGAPEGLEVAGEGVLARAGARVAATAPQGLLVGAAQGLGGQLSEDTLQNHPFVAENYWTAGIKGGLLGALLAGGTSAGLGAASDKLAPLFGKGLASTAEHAPGGLGDRLAGLAEDRAIKSAGAAKGDWMRFGKTVAEQEATAKRYGRTMLDEGITSPLATKADMAERVEKRIAEVGQQIGDDYKALDKAATKPSIRTIADTFREKFLVPMEEHPVGGVTRVVGEGGAVSHVVEAGSEAGPAQKFLDGMLAKGGEDTSFSKLQTFKAQLREKMYPGGKAPLVTPHGFEGYKALYGAISQELTTAGERAANQLGGSVADRFALNNQLFSDLKGISRILTGKAAAEGANNSVGLRTSIFGGHALHAAATAVMAGHPVGAALAAASALVHHVADKHGETIAAHALDKVAALMGASRATETVEGALSRGARAFVEGKSGKTRPMKLVTPEQIRAVRDAVRDPQTVTDRVSKALEPIEPHAKSISQAAATSAARTAAWLATALPKEQRPSGPIMTKQAERPISDAERLKASQILEVVDDPTIVMDRLAEGRLSYAHIEALKVRSPETYAKVQGYLTDHAAELRPKLTIQQQAGLSILFGVPINQAFERQYVNALQASFSTGNQAPAQVNKPGGGPPMPTNNAPIHLGQTDVTRATQFDQMERTQ